ncbi:MAG TPA: glycine cleavage T C-terminal barrel domain-containing protein [Anaerolineales bacterium]
MNVSNNLLDYQAALQGAAFFQQPDAGYLRIGGPDQADFLQRQTTNDIRRLAPGQALLTVLTSPTARILDVFHLLQEPETIGVITLPGRGASTARFLKSRIFFMDKVTVKDASAEFTQIDVMGPQVADRLRPLGINPTPGIDRVVSFLVGDSAVRVLGLNPANGLGCRLLAPAAEGAALSARLVEQGISPLKPESYELLRVEAGLPGAGSELNEAYTPLETGLEAAISSGKGCFTGQEVIARQVTYDKVTQHLCGLRLENDVKPGDNVWGEERAVGAITSAVHSPRLGPIGLAILKRPYHQPGTAVTVGERDGANITGVVSGLPFQAL